MEPFVNASKNVLEDTPFLREAQGIFRTGLNAKSALETIAPEMHPVVLFHRVGGKLHGAGLRAKFAADASILIHFQLVPVFSYPA